MTQIIKRTAFVTLMLCLAVLCVFLADVGARADMGGVVIVSFLMEIVAAIGTLFALCADTI